MTRLYRDIEGAVYVEFLIAFLPLFVVFMALCQLAYVQAAHIVVQHAAVMATRAAIVVLPDDPAYYDTPVNSATGKRLADIRRAAASPLRAVASSPDFELELPLGDAPERDSLVQVNIQLSYQCDVPIGKLLICDPLSGKKKLSGSASLPNQGAGFTYVTDE
ncbi:TadE/TadG family type IV pilus assembly protein [Sorangium sp. So ce1128]